MTELNELVAEHLDGWTWQKVWYGDVPDVLLCKPEHSPHSYPDYAGDIAAAWTVAEELNKVPGFGLDAWVRFTENWRMYGGTLLAKTSADAAKSICIAGLLAVGVSEDEINAALEPDEQITDTLVEEMQRKGMQ